MEQILNIIRMDTFLIGLFCMSIILLIVVIINSFKIHKINKENRELIEKLGKGTNIKADLAGFIHRVEKVEEKSETIINYCRDLENNMMSCIQKIGIVRYSAFRDTGSDLSFALALLDNNNNGVILNGIYSREMSNIYAKPVLDGNSTYTLIEEEKQALQQAINYKNRRDEDGK